MPLASGTLGHLIPGICIREQRSDLSDCDPNIEVSLHQDDRSTDCLEAPCIAFLMVVSDIR